MVQIGTRIQAACGVDPVPLGSFGYGAKLDEVLERLRAGQTMSGRAGSINQGLINDIIEMQHNFPCDICHVGMLISMTFINATNHPVVIECHWEGNQIECHWEGNQEP